MPFVDVTELFEDPDLASPLTVTRFKQVIDQHGRVFATPGQTVQGVGVVQPASGRTLAYLPDLARTSGAIEVWCRLDLKEATQNTSADEVTWMGQNYVVMHVDGWRNEGGGSFTHAICELKGLVATSEAFGV